MLDVDGSNEMFHVKSTNKHAALVSFFIGSSFFSEEVFLSKSVFR